MPNTVLTVKQFHIPVCEKLEPAGELYLTKQRPLSHKWWNLLATEVQLLPQGMNPSQTESPLLF